MPLGYQLNASYRGSDQEHRRTQSIIATPLESSKKVRRVHMDHPSRSPTLMGQNPKPFDKTDLQQQASATSFWESKLHTHSFTNARKPMRACVSFALRFGCHLVLEETHTCWNSSALDIHSMLQVMTPDPAAWSVQYPSEQETPKPSTLNPKLSLNPTWQPGFPKDCLLSGSPVWK